MSTDDSYKKAMYHEKDDIIKDFNEFIKTSGLLDKLLKQKLKSTETAAIKTEEE